MDNLNVCPTLGFTKNDIYHWCCVLGVTAKELVNMSDEDFEQKLTNTHERISSQSCESCSKWCDEFVNDFGKSSDCEKSRDDQIWTILQKAGDEIAKAPSRNQKTSYGSNKLLDAIREILAKAGIERSTQTNGSVETLSQPEECEEHKTPVETLSQREECEEPKTRVETVYNSAMREAQHSILALLNSLKKDQELFANSEKNYESHLKQSRKRSKSEERVNAKRKYKGEKDTERTTRSTDRSRLLSDLIERDACAIMRNLHTVLRNTDILEKHAK